MAVVLRNKNLIVEREHESDRNGGISMAVVLRNKNLIVEWERGWVGKNKYGSGTEKQESDSGVGAWMGGMFRVPDYQENLSLRLSEVLDDIGISEEMVLKRRRSTLLYETMATVLSMPIKNKSIHMFGSFSEGTTTAELRSDIDCLQCDFDYNVIQDYAKWKHGFKNLLMIRDNTTSPGYCLLQQIRDDVPLPATHALDKYHVRDASRRVLLKNTVYSDNTPADAEQHGPSWARQGIPGIKDSDHVPAMHCKSWPYEATAWLDRKRIGSWPTADMKRFAANNGCFVVPVGSKVSQSPELEWRISTSQAERCVMFSLNITQIRCYVLMKMILKTFLHHAGEGNISSFMCKTILLYCIENTHSNAWQESNLFTWLSCCLHVLYKCLQQENCPHFIIPENNLMAGQFSPEVKALLLERTSFLIQTDGQALLEVQIDDLGQRLQIKLNMLYQIAENISSKKENYLCISGRSLHDIASNIPLCSGETLLKIIQNSPVTTVQTLLNVIAHYKRCYIKGSKLEQKACSLLTPLVCSTLGTTIASINIQTNNALPPEALDWLSAGLNSDVASSRLKLSSVFYSVGNMIETEFILRNTEGHYGFGITEAVCGCYEHFTDTILRMFAEAAYHQNEEVVRNVCAFCVKFTPAETHCVPRELQYEMNRSTLADLLHRDEVHDYWMDWAVVDSLPYLYFLQYKTYRHLQRSDDQHQALANLARTVETEVNLGHRETALNLLGQCMEQENQPNKALICYMRSLKIRERNNAARLHICRLLANFVSNLR
ncbi:uncharacterized protein LOC123562132 [Mercenaria mercenaria]|uniref:uncharacterized protein LOC123562132 n=1 Tax=Mercenaria mercenaria TaxID=6596 RepID=UPI00234F8B28|nr:uncharacterized protein LOC123562132 [Mercenaria mercenaria]